MSHVHNCIISNKIKLLFRPEKKSKRWDVIDKFLKGKMPLRKIRKVPPGQDDTGTGQDRLWPSKCPPVHRKISLVIFKIGAGHFLTVSRTSKYRQNTIDSSGTGQTSIDSSIYETPRSHRPYRSGFPKRYVSFDSNWVKQVPGQPRMFLERTYVRTINQSNTRVNNGIFYRLSISLVPI